MSTRDVVVRSRLPPGAPGVALTFDDCDDERAWGEVLDVLEAEAVPATFFANGMRVAQFQDAARRTIAGGHVVGAHGWDHTDFSRLKEEEVRERLLADRRAWGHVGATNVVLFRPPFGRYSANVLVAARRAAYRELVLWDVDPRDWQLPDPEAIVSRVLQSCSARNIVDLHVTMPTALALPRLITGLRHRGLACLPLSPCRHPAMKHPP